VPRNNTQCNRPDMKEQYYPTPEKSFIPGPTFRTGCGDGLEQISPIAPLEPGLGCRIGRRAGDQYQKFQLQIGPSF